MTKVIVFHADYGCDTGCCGHVIQVGEDQTFDFVHPYELYKAKTPEEEQAYLRKWAEDLVRSTLGEEHVADLDWENCVISDD